MHGRGLALTLLVAGLCLPLGAAARPGAPLRQAPSYQLFPRTSHWNQRVVHLPVAENSAAVVAAIGPADRLHADFGAGLCHRSSTRTGRTRGRVRSRRTWESKADARREAMIVADDGSNWFVSGAPHPRWSNEQLQTPRRLAGSAFEVVDTAGLPRP